MIDQSKTCPEQTQGSKIENRKSECGRIRSLSEEVAMVDAKALLDEMRKELQPVSEQLLQHPYVQALEVGKIGREKLRLFAGEQYNIIASDLRSVAHLVSRFGSAPSRDFFLGILQGERAAWDALLTFA